MTIRQALLVICSVLVFAVCVLIAVKNDLDVQRRACSNRLAIAHTASDSLHIVLEKSGCRYALPEPTP